MRLAAIALICIGLLVPGAASAPDVTARVIEREVYYHQPLAPCAIPSAAMQIARATQVPVGIERLPGDCVVPQRWQAGQQPYREKVYLTGKTAGEALNELITADPRYAWIESDDVIVVRPVSAFANRQHFLHRTIRSFSVIDQHLGAALDEWRNAMWDDEGRRESESMRAAQRTEEGNRPFTVILGTAPTAIGALEQIARAHGRLAWEVQYCQPVAESKYATVYLWTLEADPTGVGVPLKGRFSAVNGKTVDACRSIG